LTDSFGTVCRLAGNLISRALRQLRGVSGALPGVKELLAKSRPRSLVLNDVGQDVR
jgi:hypothetical protein